MGVYSRRILGITDKHCWTKAGALGIPDVNGIGKV